MSKDPVQTPAPEGKKPRGGSVFTPEFWVRARAIYAASDSLSPAKAAAQAAQEMGLPKPPHHSSAAERADREKWARGGSKPADTQQTQPASGQAPAQPAKGKTEDPAHQGGKEPEVDHMAALTPLQVVFVNAYLLNLNGTRAYMEAKPDCKESVAASEAWRLLRNPKVAAAVHQRMAERIKRMEVDQDEVLRRYLTRLEADPRELVEFHRGACRYCFGEGHQYQYTPAEMAKAKDRHEKDWKLRIAKSKGKLSEADIPPFDEQGGLGFNARLEPNPACPECHGDGEGRVIIKDTRYLSPGALALYGGVEEGKDGIKVRIGNRDDALLQVARHTGFFEADNENTVFTAAAPEQLDAIYAAKRASAKKKAEMVKDRVARVFGSKADDQDSGAGEG